ncbi:MAG: hypothetical protein HYT76_01970 [Deltaproteobacteria bacterium]|nr:hypothetical protein [Deltaproteobacteria bacterium]
MKRMRTLFLISFVILGGCFGGTETGNPQTPGVPKEEEPNYTNDDFGVSARYDSGWSVTETPAAGSPDSTTAGDAPIAAPAEGIDTSDSPSTEFTDGTTIVTIYYVTLNSVPDSLLNYLESKFPSRVFQEFSNSQISGFKYDNPEAGDTGGDRQEYYFLNEKTLLYVITDLFDVNDGLKKFEAFIDSLRFE